MGQTKVAISIRRRVSCSSCHPIPRAIPFRTASVRHSLQRSCRGVSGNTRERKISTVFYLYDTVDPIASPIVSLPKRPKPVCCRRSGVSSPSSTSRQRTSTLLLSFRRGSSLSTKAPSTNMIFRASSTTEDHPLTIQNSGPLSTGNLHTRVVPFMSCSPGTYTHMYLFFGSRLIFRRDLKTLAKILQLAKEREEERTVLDSIHLLIAAVNQKQKDARIAVSQPALPTGSRDRAQAQRAWDAIQLLQGDRTRLATLAVSGAEAVVGLITYAESDLSSLEQLQQLAHFVAHHRKSDVYLELLRGDFGGALAHMEDIDWWLSMHLLDLMDTSTHTLAPSVVTKGARIGSRAWIVMVYTRYLRNEERLWPYILDYVATCNGDADICLKKVRTRYPQCHLISSQPLCT